MAVVVDREVVKSDCVVDGVSETVMDVVVTEEVVGVIIVVVMLT